MKEESSYKRFCTLCRYLKNGTWIFSRKLQHCLLFISQLKKSCSNLQIYINILKRSLLFQLAIVLFIYNYFFLLHINEQIDVKYIFLKNVIELINCILLSKIQLKIVFCVCYSNQMYKYIYYRSECGCHEYFKWKQLLEEIANWLRLCTRYMAGCICKYNWLWNKKIVLICISKFPCTICINILNSFWFWMRWSVWEEFRLNWSK